MFVVGRGREEEAGVGRKEGEREEEREREMSVVFVWRGVEGGREGGIVACVVKEWETREGSEKRDVELIRGQGLERRRW